MRRTSEKGAGVSNHVRVARLGDSVVTQEDRTVHQPDDATDSGRDQALRPIATLLADDFVRDWDLVTRDVLPLRRYAGARP